MKDNDADPESQAQAEPTIRLDQYLKWIGRARSGGEAKHRIQAGEVQVNGRVETRRSHKLRSGDRVTIDGETIAVELPPAPPRGDEKA